MHPELYNPQNALAATKSSVIVHPVLWTLGAVAVVGAIGYFAFFRKPKKPAAATAAS